MFVCLVFLIISHSQQFHSSSSWLLHNNLHHKGYIKALSQPFFLFLIPRSHHFFFFLFVHHFCLICKLWILATVEVSLQVVMKNTIHELITQYSLPLSSITTTTTLLPNLAPSHNTLLLLLLITNNTNLTLLCLISLQATSTPSLNQTHSSTWTPPHPRRNLEDLNPIAPLMLPHHHLHQQQQT